MTFCSSWYCEALVTFMEVWSVACWNNTDNNLQKKLGQTSVRGKKGEKAGEGETKNEQRTWLCLPISSDYFIKFGEAYSSNYCTSTTNQVSKSKLKTINCASLMFLCQPLLVTHFLLA